MIVRRWLVYNSQMLNNSQRHTTISSRLLLLVTALLLGLIALAGCLGNHEFAGAAFTEPVALPEVSLDSINGPVRLQDFSGKYTFVYFGYTFCPDICPATLARLEEVKQELGNDADEIAVVMVTVDPDRDTPEKLAEYMAFFDDSFVGLSGEKADIDALGTPFGLFYEQHEGTAESGYLVDHTAWFYLLDRDSNLIIAYPHETEAAALLDDLRYLLRQD